MATKKAKTVKPQSFWKWVDHNHYLVTGIALSVLIAVFFTACTPKTASLILPPPAKVTDTQLQAELVEIQGNYDTLLAKAEIAEADLEAQYAFRAKLVETAGSVITLAAGGGLNPVLGAAAGLQLLTLLGGAGLFLDNRRKDRVILEKTNAA